MRTARSHAAVRIAAIPSRETGRPSWLPRLRHTWQAINMSVRRIDCSCRAIDASVHLAVRRPMAASRRLLEVSDWLDEARKQLDHAAHRLKSTLEAMARDDGKSGGAVDVIRTAAILIETMARLAATAARLEAEMAAILESVKRDGSGEDLRPFIPAPSKPAIRWFLIHCPSHPADSIRLLLLQRWRCTHAAALADTPRKVSRGRAPPFLSICSL